MVDALFVHHHQKLRLRPDAFGTLFRQLMRGHATPNVEIMQVATTCSLTEKAAHFKKPAALEPATQFTIVDNATESKISAVKLLRQKCLGRGSPADVRIDQSAAMRLNDAPGLKPWLWSARSGRLIWDVHLEASFPFWRSTRGL